MEPDQTLATAADYINLLRRISSSSPIETADETSNSWQDLNESLSELILERLPLSAYLRFTSVCRRWRSIQISHRLRHHPLSPPMLALPWIIIHQQNQNQHQDPVVICYSPFERRSYRLSHLNNPPRASETRRVLTSSNGWLALLSSEGSTFCLALLNPVTGVELHLPPLMKSPVSFAAVAASSPLDESNCVVLVKNEDHVFFLIRPGQPHWTMLLLRYALGIRSVVSLAGKFYCGGQFCPIGVKAGLTVINQDFIDGWPPVVEHLNMNCGQLDNTMACRRLLAELDGELWLVEFPKCPEWYDAAEVRVFKADLLEKMWVKMESIGDWMLLLDRNSCHSLVAADVGGRRNCIYFSGEFVNVPRDAPDGWSPWKIFDLAAGKFTNGEHRILNPESEHDVLESALCWFMPSLGDVNPATVRDQRRLC